MSDPTAPCTATAHDPEVLCDELHAARLDKANLAREVDHLQRESADAHERIAAGLAILRDETSNNRHDAIRALSKEAAPHDHSGGPCPDCGRDIERHEYVECLECLCGDCLVCDEESSHPNHDGHRALTEGAGQ